MEQYKLRTRKWGGLAPIAVVAVLALTACTAADDGPATSGDARADVNFDDDALASAQASIDGYSAVPEYQGPTDPVDMTQVAGKKIYLIAFDLSNDFNKRLADGFVEAAKLNGVETVVLSSGNNAATSTSYINQAIADKAAGIVTISVGVEQVPQAISAVAKAGIPYITMAQTSASDDPGEGISNQVTADTRAIGAAQVDYAYTVTGEDTNVVAYGGYSLPQDVAQLEGQEARLAELCPDCSHKKNDVDLSTFQTALPGIVQSAIVADPDVSWVLPAWDILGTYVLPGIKSANAQGRVNFSTWNGIPASLDQVKNGDQAVDFGVPLRWWSWAAFDMIARYVAGQDVPPNAEHLPTRMFTAETLADIDDMNDESALYGDDHVFDTYKEMWGVK